MISLLSIINQKNHMCFDYLSHLKKEFIALFKHSKIVKILFYLIFFLSLITALVYLLNISFYQNITNSNPYSLFIGIPCYTPKKDIYVVAFPSFSKDQEKLNNIPIIKKIKGMPGDQISLFQSSVYINTNYMGKIENFNDLNLHLSAITPQMIPNGFYYLGSDSLDKSFDSRYEQFGLVSKENIRCQVWPIF